MAIVFFFLPQVITLAQVLTTLELAATGRRQSITTTTLMAYTSFRQSETWTTAAAASAKVSVQS